ncbi:hypothetical protein BH11PLA2_BH11PLA2_07770 [soil metagenome]
MALGQSSPTVILTQPSPLAAEAAESRTDEIETDRDSFTPSARTVDRKRLVLESGYTYSNHTLGDAHSLPELLFRYGATDCIEMRFGVNYERANSADLLTGVNEREQKSNLNLGTKVRVTKQEGWIPESSLVLTALVPTSGLEPSTRFVATYVVGWEMPNRWKLDAAIRYGTNSFDHDHFNDWAPSIVLKMPIGEKWSVHAEYFGIFTSGKEHDSVVQYFSPGVHYLATPDLEVGTRVGWGLNDQSARFFANVGLGYRF